MGLPRLLSGRYELEGAIGRGGMATVFRARDVLLDRVVAIKTLHAELGWDLTLRARFWREAAAAASLGHPSVVAIYDIREDVDGPYIVMEYVNGKTLLSLVQENGPLAAKHAAEITDGVVQALAFSHHKGIIHRDIKPANVMLTAWEQVKVMDFGLARTMRDAQGTMTQTAQVMGTVQYGSPEQLTGGRVDERSDLYSTGCLMYELLTGRPPFDSTHPTTIAAQHVHEDPVPPSLINADIPGWADSITLKAMAKRPSDRYQSAEDLHEDIKRALCGMPVKAPFILVRYPDQKISAQHVPMPSTFAKDLAGTTTITGGWNSPTTVDFEIRIPSSEDAHVRRVEIRASEGELTAPIQVPDSQGFASELGHFHQVLDTARLDPGLPGINENQVLRDFGARLFGMLLPGEAKMLYYSCRAASNRLRRNLRIVLRIGPQDLAELPWEFMYDTKSCMFLGLHYPIIRYVEQALPSEKLWTKASPLRVLGMIAAPRNRSELDSDSERSAVTAALHTLIELGQVRIDWVKGGRWEDLQRKLYKRQYNVFHFVGHGGFDNNDGEGYLEFTDRAGFSDKVPATDLAALFSGQHQLQLVVLNSCESSRGSGFKGRPGLAEALVRQGIGAVLAMQETVSDPVATRFVTGFYDALAASVPIDLATLYGRHAVRRIDSGSLEWGTPVIFLRSREPVYFLAPPGE